MDADAWAARILADEGAPGVRVLLDALVHGPDAVELNVWTVDVRRADGVVHVDHAFDPDAGDVALDDLVAALAGLDVIVESLRRDT